MTSITILSVLFVNIFIMQVQSQECGPPEDCIVSEWNQWSECTQTCGDSGTRTRGRTLYREATCGGICPHDIEESEPCNRRCCPVDCTFTAWTDWFNCSCTEAGCVGDGERYKCSRTRRKLSNATCGGYCDERTDIKQCGYLCCIKDCILGFWAPWSTCDAPCEQRGTKRRSREVIQDTACGGRPCTHTEEVVNCTRGCCPTHCVFGEWGEWGSCSTTCGQGTQIRNRFVQLPECGGDSCAEEPLPGESRTCSNNATVDCVISAWSTWSSCFLDNGFCGEGTKSRTRTVLTPPVCDGEKCGTLTDTRTCYGQCCRRDCDVSGWSEWGPCSAPCGQGVSNRTRSVETWPDCGGALCPPDLLETRGCLVTEVKDCQLTVWSDWTACSTDCGEGVITRSRQLISPAYCGGTCENGSTLEEEACESYTARQNCEVSEWSDWSFCVRDCEGGVQERTRSIISEPVCDGTPCPNLTDRKSCHVPCEQLCEGGSCSCRFGYRLNADNATCTEITCPPPQLEYCPQTHRHITDCRYPEFTCSTDLTYNQTCSAHCTTENWTLKGPSEISCGDDGSWTQPYIYCVRQNKPPLGIDVDQTTIKENTPENNCFIALSTVTSDDEKGEIHAYSITADDTERFYIKDNSVCLTRKTDYEEKPDIWDVTFRSTDMEGEFVEGTFTFEVLNVNDPPTSVKLEPDNVLENSLAGTVVGCFVGMDDDPGQTLNFTLVNSLQEIFSSFVENGKTCLKVVQESDTLCSTEGGTHCVLNRELQFEHRVTVKVTDDGDPPQSAMFDVPIYLSDVNDRQTAVEISPNKIPENIPTGEGLVKLVTVDEDAAQTYTYRILRDSSGLFAVKGGHLTANNEFDFERDGDSLFELEIESTDDATPPMVVSSVIKIKIEDLNEPPYQLQLSSLNGVHPFDLNKPRVPENFKGVTGTVMVKDQDSEDHVKISLESTYSEAPNIVLSSTKCTYMTDFIFCTSTVSIETSFDFEDKKTHNISLLATDTLGKVSVLNVSLAIIDINDPPSTLLIDEVEYLEIEVPENELDFRIGELSVLDDEKTDKHEFKVTESASGLFRLEGNSLKTSKTRALDFERKDAYYLVITVTDNGEPMESSNFNVTVRIKDVNEAPSSTVLSNNKIVENIPAGSVVGTLTTSDPDNVIADKQQFTYTLSDDSLGRFILQGNTLMVRNSPQSCGASRCVLDYEEEPSVTVKVITVDDGEPRMHREDKFIIHLEDTNDPPTDIRIDGNMIKENQPAGSLIGTLTATDVDGDTITYILKNFVDVFDIQDGNHLVTRTSLDYERLNNYRLLVLASDNGNHQGETEETLAIHVIDVNEPPVFLNVSNTMTVREDTEIGRPVVTWAISDPDSGEDIVIFLTDHSNTFSVTGPVCETTPLTGATDCTMVLYLMATVTDADSFVISIYVSDKEGLTSRQTIQMEIQDVNVKPTDILLNGIPSNEILLPENTRGTVVAVLVAVDRDDEQTHTFEVVSETNSQFEIDGDKLQTKSTANIDFENSTQEMLLEIKVTDSGDPPLSFSKTFVVVVEDVNEAPAGAKLSTNTIPENSPIGTVIGNIGMTDPDNGQLHSLVLVSDGGGRFVLNRDTLQVSDAGEGCVPEGANSCKLNFEEKSEYNIEIEVADTGTPSLVALFTLQIDLTDVNEKPRDIKLTSNKLLIGSATGDSIGVLTVEDEDISQTHIFEAVQSSPFMKISSAGEVTVSDSQSLIEGQILELNIRCTDNGNPPLATTETLQIVAVGTNVVTVAIEAIGETVQVDRNTVEIEEGNNAGDAVAKLVLSYPLTNRNIETKIIKADEYIQTDTVTCNNVGGQSICEVNLITLSSLDYENLKFFDATFESSTDTTRTIDTLRLYVQDKNEAPTGLTFGTGNIRVTENSMNQLIGTFSVTDQDGSDTHVFTIPESENFILTDGGQLFTSSDADIDFETVTSTTISVTVVDKGDLAYTQEFEVSVIDINEAPTGLSLTSNDVPEMSSNGTYIGTFIVSDPDSGQSHTFEILNDVDNRFVTEGSDLLVGDMGSDCITRGGSYCLLDSESKAEFNVTVKVTDNGIKPLSAAFVITIRVMDVNDPPRDISISLNKVLEDTEVGHTVAVLDAADDDLGQTLTFDISNTNYFSINGQNLILSTPLDYETATEHQIEIIVMDNGTPLLKTSAVFTIHVVNVNEPPISVMLSPTADSPSPFDIDEPSIEEDMPPLLYIGQLVALDADKNDVIRIESTTKDVVIRNTACIPVSKGTRCTADVRSGHLFDFEADELVEIAFICTDSGGLQLKKDITLKIIDTNDAPTNIFLNGSDISEIIVPENSRDSLLAKLSVDDNEKDQTYIYTLSGRSSYIMVTDDELWIPSAAVLDFESQKQIPFTIRVTDSGTPAKSFQKDLVLMITDLNEVPSDLYLTSYMIPETANEGYTVGTFVTIDPDTVDSEINPVFSIMLPNADSLFRVEGSSLVVAKPEFDYEKKRYFEEEVVVSDSGEPVMSSTFTLTLEVSDVNEAPTIIDFVGDAVEESVDIGFVVGKLSARDPDQGQTLMFSVTGTDLLSVNGDTVVTLGSMDYEAMKELHFTAIVTDTGSPPLSVVSLEKDFTLPVVDVNEPPKDIVVIDNDKMELSEDSEVDQEIVKLKLFDEDHVERLQLEVVYGMDFFNLNPTGLACSVDDEDGTVCTTSLYLTTKLDYESGQSSIDVSVLARDKGGLILQKTFSFSVANVKEPPIDILLDTTTEFVPENTPNFVVGTLSTVEDDWFESHTYVVVSPWELFTTSGNLLIVKAALDFELQNTYTVSVRSQDNSHRPMFLVKEFEIRVGDLNEAPSGIELIPTEVARTATIDELVAEILVNDPDNTGRPGSQTHICEVSSSEYFQVDNSKLVLKMKSVLPGDVEGIQLTIICSDSGEPALNTSFDFILQVVDTVNAPSEITLLDLSGSETVSVEENKVDVVVGQLSIVNLLTKEPIEAVVEFSTSDNSQLFYEVIGDKLRVVKDLDFETMSISSVQIAAVGTGISGEMIALSKRFTISVTDVNEPPTGIDVSGNREVRENSKEGTVIGTLVTYDAEQYQSYTYTILGVSYGLSATKADVDMLNAFVIDGDVLKVGKDVMFINYEESDIVSILINSEDSGTPSYNVTVLVRMVVENVKELPTDILLSNSIIAENSPMDTIVGTLSVLAEDGEQHQACEILNLMEVPFKISNSYQLVVADDGLDFEVQTNFIVKISCGDAIQDGAKLSFSKTFVVNVTNVNEAPTHLELSKQTVVENNEIGQAVAEIIVEDEDSDTLYISIEDQTGGGHFVIEDEKTLVARRGFDYEEGQFYKVTIKAADDQDKFIMKEFEIEILNENEIPTLIQLDNHVVSENAGPRSIVGQLTTRDQDWNQEYTYELDSDTFESGSFKISGTALIVGDSGLDYEATSSYEITITSTDNGSPPKSITEDFLIEILDANDPPTAIIVTDIGTVLENATVNLLLASFRVDDPDLGQRHACSIDEDAGFVSIQMKATADPELLLAKPVDYEEMKTLDVLLSCTDGEYNIKQKIAIPVGDVNEAPTAITLSGSNTVLSDAPRDSVIGTLSVDDEDFGQRHSFTISGQNSDIVRISSDNELILLDLIPVETLENDDPSLKLIVTVADNGEPVMQYSQTITLPVTDVEIPVNSLPAVELNVIELTTVMKKEKVISRLFSANATITSSIQFTLASDSYNAFAIINNTFLVLANDVVNIEVDSFEIVIQVEDVVTLQKETMEVVVSILRDFSCVPSEHNCMENEMCVERNETYFECDCIEDFLRDIDGECLKVDNCMVNDNSEKVVTQLCLNGGTCVDGIDNFSCSCTEDFEGTRCEIDKSTTDMCSPSPCLNEGTCSQNADGSSYSCSCKIGWTGFMCESSIDECEGARCLHGGMCIDKYLTYLCTCEDGWKGLRCEYYSSVCADRFCNDSHVCVGLVSSNRTLCAEVDTHLINLEYEKPETNDIKTFQTRLVYFIINYGGLPIVDINTNRRKREVISNETQVYVVDAEETPAKYAYTFTVLDNAGTLLTRDFVLETLSESCHNIDFSNPSVEVFCPSILEASQQEQTTPPNSSSSAGIIAGIIITILLIVILSVAAVVIWKKQKTNKIEPQLMSENVPVGSRDGYATMPTQRDIPAQTPAETPNEDMPLTVNTSIIQVAPAEECNAYSSVV